MKLIKIITFSLLTFALFTSVSYAGTLDVGIQAGSGPLQTAVEPVASPTAGTYTSSQSVTLTASGADQIRYTTDGSDPTCSSGTVYSSAISVTTTQTIKAVSCYLESYDQSYSSSLVASFAYTINSSRPPMGGGGGTTITPITTDSDSTTKPIAEMTDEELLSEINRLTALLVQLQTLLAQMTGGGEGIPASCATVTFNRNLPLGAVGDDVKCLQALLNTDPATQIALSGVGSPGNETNYFGSLTRIAVIKFQEKYAAEVLTPGGFSSGTGYVGPLTRTKLNQLLGR